MIVAAGQTTSENKVSGTGYCNLSIQEAGEIETYRMGDDSATSVVIKYHRAHDVPNLFTCDGSSFTCSGRGRPTMTIQALAFRAAEHITRFAPNGEI